MRTVENFVIKALEDENIQLKKKIENLHIALNKKVEKNKNQKEEISLLLKQKEELKELWNNEALRAKKNNLDMQIHLLEIMEFKNQLKEKDIIIKYLEDRLNEK
jgi:hypothetical protein